MIIVNNVIYEKYHNGFYVKDYIGEDKDVIILDKIEDILVTKIGEGAFYAKDIKSIKLPPSLEIIDSFAFYNNDFKEVIIPNSVKYIEKYAFGHNNDFSLYFEGRIDEINISDPIYDDGKCFLKDRYVKQVNYNNIIYKLFEDKTAIVTGQVNKNTQINAVVEKSIIGYLTEIISYSAFENSKIKYINIPNSIKIIQSSAFKNSNISEVILPNSILIMGSSVFRYCRFLRKIVYPKLLKEIGSFSHEDNLSLINVDLPTNIRVINESAFMSCVALKNIHLPNTLRELKSQSFKYCNNLRNIIIPEKVRIIGNSVFDKLGDYDNNYVNDINLIILSDNLIIGENNFNELSIDKIYCRESIKSFFMNNKKLVISDILKIKIIDDIKYLILDEYAVVISNKLSINTLRVEVQERVDFKPVIKISSNVFNNLVKLKEIIIPDTMLRIGNNVFHNPTNIKIFNNKNKKEITKRVLNLNITVSQSNDDVIIDGVYYKKANDEYKVFRYYGNHNQIYLRNEINNYKVTEISSYAFNENDIEYLILPKYLKKIDKDSFINCNIKYIFLNNINQILNYEVLFDDFDTTYVFEHNIDTLDKGNSRNDSMFYGKNLLKGYEKTVINNGFEYMLFNNKTAIVSNYYGEDKDVIIDENIEGYIVNTVLDLTFKNKEYDKVCFPKTITNIDYIFHNTKVEEITISDTLYIKYKSMFKSNKPIKINFI